MQIPFGLESYQHTSLPLSAQRAVNCYLEPAPPKAKTLAAVIASYGVQTKLTIGTGPHRGAKVIRGNNYVVSGTKLYRQTSLTSATELGDIPGTGRVFIEGDETNIAVLDPTTQLLFYWNGSALLKNTSEGYPGFIWLGYLDGYFLGIQQGTGKFYITANRDPGSVDALDFFSAERYPDDLVTGTVDHGELIGFGTESFEGYYDSGNTDAPITKIASADGEIGCNAPYGPGKNDNSIFFPGSDDKVYRLNGYTPQVISTPVVEQALARATDRNFIGLVWKEAGHSFYALKCADFAFVYDITSNLWFERESYGVDAWRWAWVVRCFDSWIVGDAESNAVGVLSPDTFTEFGDVMRVSCTSPPVGADNKRIFHGRVELVFEQGVGLVSGQGSDPQVMLQFSDDGGRTWSSERWRSLGRIGNFRERAVWYRGGQARDRIYRYAISDPVRRTLVFATTEAIAGGD